MAVAVNGLSDVCFGGVKHQIKYCRMLVALSELVTCSIQRATYKHNFLPLSINYASHTINNPFKCIFYSIFYYHTFFNRAYNCGIVPNFNANFHNCFSAAFFTFSDDFFTHVKSVNQYINIYLKFHKHTFANLINFKFINSRSCCISVH
uniref:Uncharacterized protein n=1 Tax=Plectus sambesii TaxID=2011161 RepID=A0A914V3A4_9BILA